MHQCSALVPEFISLLLKTHNRVSWAKLINFQLTWIRYNVPRVAIGLLYGR